MKYLNDDLIFPDVSQATKEGLLAIGGDLSINRLLLAYSKGIFPWYEKNEPILWWSPDPRFVLFPKKLKVTKSMKQLMRNKEYVITVNRAFKQVILECAKIKRDGQSGTWITNEMIDSYNELHDLGFAKSVEVWENEKLIGGLYGVEINNNVFCGESMFSKKSNASKIGFVSFIQNSNYKIIDCQVHTNHLESLGAEHISRDIFLKYLN